MTLKGAEIPYLIQSAEGMLHGPFGPGATILVRPDHADEARELLTQQPERSPGAPVALIGAYATQQEAEAVSAKVRAAGIACYTTSGQQQVSVYVPRDQAEAARRAIKSETRDNTR